MDYISVWLFHLKSVNMILFLVLSSHYKVKITFIKFDLLICTHSCAELLLFIDY